MATPARQSAWDDDFRPNSGVSAGPRPLLDGSVGPARGRVSFAGAADDIDLEDADESDWRQSQGARNDEADGPDHKGHAYKGVMPTATEHQEKARHSLISKVEKVDKKIYQQGEDEEIIAQGCSQKFIAYLIYAEEFLEEKNVPPGLPPPRCLETQGSSLKIYLEDSKGCRRVGKLGFAFFMFLRKITLITCIVFTICAFFLRAFPPFAMVPSQGKYRGFIDEYPWATGLYKCQRDSECNGMDAEMWLGLASFRIESRTHHRFKVVRWADPNCPEELSSLGAATYCEKCADASFHCAGLAISSLPFVLVNFFIDFQRLSDRTDRNCAKATALVCNTCGMVLLIAAITAFMHQCVGPFPRIDAAGNFQLEMGVGRGGYLVVFSIVTNFFVILVHICLPSPPRAHDPNFNFEADRMSRSLSTKKRAASRFVKIFGEKYDPKKQAEKAGMQALVQGPAQKDDLEEQSVSEDEAEDDRQNRRVLGSVASEASSVHAGSDRQTRMALGHVASAASVPADELNRAIGKESTDEAAESGTRTKPDFLKVNAL